MMNEDISNSVADARSSGLRPEIDDLVKRYWNQPVASRWLPSSSFPFKAVIMIVLYEARARPFATIVVRIPSR